MTELTGTTSNTPLAFIYDRTATSEDIILRTRYPVCLAYVAEHRWVLAGRWFDRGDYALSDDRRPEFDRLVRAMKDAEAGRPRVCLVFGWERLSRNPKASGLMSRRVLQAGGWVETVDGEKRDTDGSYHYVGSNVPGPAIPGL